MRMHNRLRRLERRLDAETDRIAQRENFQWIGLLLGTDPVPAGEFAILLNKIERLEKTGGVLTLEDCAEGTRLAARLTSSLRVAQLAAGMVPDGMIFPFDYKPGVLGVKDCHVTG